MMIVKYTDADLGGTSPKEPAETEIGCEEATKVLEV